MVMQVASLVPAGLVDLSVSVVLASAILILVIQLPPVNRRRVIAALIIAAVSGAALIAADAIIYDRCKELEPWSLEWLALSCWMW